MNYLKAVIIVIFVTFIAGCDSVEDAFTDDVIDPDSRITEQDALQQNYNFKTPVYNISVAIDSDVNLSVDDVLNRIDQEAMEFLDCQFFDGADIGFENFMLADGTIVTPLSELRIFVVPFNFECDAVDKNICAGIQFSGSDLIIIAESGFGRCGDLPLLKHEIAHRYGLTPTHNNQDEFDQCSDPESCGIIDTLDDLNIFG